MEKRLSASEVTDVLDLLKRADYLQRVAFQRHLELYNEEDVAEEQVQQARCYARKYTKET